MSADPAGDFGVALLPLSVSPASYIEYATIVKPDGLAGFVFDYYSNGDFKFAGVNSVDNTVVIGHFKGGAWTIDASVVKTIKTGKSYELGIAMVGTKVSVSLGGQLVTSQTYNSLLNDGALGLLTRGGNSFFDSLTVWGDDQDFEIFGETAGTNLTHLLAGIFNPTFTVTWVVDEEEA